ncbi:MULTISPECIES: NUDIX hydrolase [unclassified Amycolatopsis]|uniref:NUDIX hydrolase n=1 Tax=unclassified Amycolatopsis TaxID=2618356 RepID=UPI00287638E8|nr:MULTISPECIES: NUDIX hydrolase [unclassified Amycolatopsis]MDS0140549.1 NUDIX hydrolase [Amycolatopsis sp. 505]MDS0149199.1 NUDIX hydrolase [Amycolatopsis sp. CM201R]
MTTPTATQQRFFENYPMAIPSAGVLFFDGPSYERLLVVKPRGRQWWEIPGGVNEARRGESPRGTARREIAEELGLDVVIGRLLGTDSVPEGDDHAPMLAFVYEGGILTPEQNAAIRYVDHEIGERRYVAPDLDQLAEMMVPRLARRVVACALHARTGNPEPLCLEHGYVPAA